MKNLAICAAALALSTPLSAQDHPANNVSEARLRADIDTLVGFGTRHTLSEQDNPARGIGAAVDWGAAEFGRISAQCGGCLEVVLPERIVEGPRIPQPTRLRNAVAIQRGSERPNEVVIVQGHIDSRVSDPLDWKSDAPGANDDGSGTVLVIEAARVLSQHQYPATIIYALLSGEEQGLFGGRLLADWAEEQGFTVKAVLNNDIVGGSCGSDGYCDDQTVRVFSEGPRADLTDGLRAQQRRNGGENDSPGRNLSRWIDQLAAQDAEGLDVRQIWRTDRMGRGGDQIPFLDKGYPAVRFSVAVEDYEHQHQDLRVEDGVTYGDTVNEMDFAYLAKVTQLNVRALDALARAPMPPKVTVDAAARLDTELKWQVVPGASLYTIATRPTDAPGWSKDVTLVYLDGPAAANDAAAAEAREVKHIKKLRGDDWLFGVAACAGEYCSPVSSAVPGGAFEPVVKE
ncbi:MAG: peptidase M28 [Erythrobacter sp.]|nr:peptidase M28 [Erythrobacter sp.]